MRLARIRLSEIIASPQFFLGIFAVKHEAREAIFNMGKLYALLSCSRSTSCASCFTRRGEEYLPTRAVALAADPA